MDLFVEGVAEPGEKQNYPAKNPKVSHNSTNSTLVHTVHAVHIHCLFPACPKVEIYCPVCINDVLITSRLSKKAHRCAFVLNFMPFLQALHLFSAIECDFLKFCIPH